VIDAGLPGSWLLLRRAIRRIGRDAGQIARILLTHEHPDHAGGAQAVARATGAEMGGAAQLADGELHGVQGGLAVLRTPGHTPGSLASTPPATGSCSAVTRSGATADISTIAFGHLAPLHGDCTAGMRDLLARWTSPTG